MGQIRITGGSHRSRKITVEDQPGLRPTGDRIRETLFNWLGHNLHGFEVLDLYSGSGILAFEAASRGAQRIQCVENNSKTVMQLKKNIASLNFDNFKVNQQSAQKFIDNNQQSFDLIFLDPPFGGDDMQTISGIIEPLCQGGGYLYREFGAEQAVPTMDESYWQLNKQKQAGQVCFELWQKKSFKHP